MSAHPSSRRNLAEMVRMRAKARGDAIAYEFEGRQTSFRGVRPQDQSRCQRADRDRREAARAHRLSRQEQRHLFRAAAGRDEGQCGDGAGELAARRPGSRLHRRGLQGAGAVRRSRNSSRRSATSSDKLPNVRTVITTEGGAPEWQDFTAWRDAQSADDPKVAISPQGHRDPALHFRHDRQAKGRDAVARQFPQSRQTGNDRKPDWNKWNTDDVSLVAMPIFHIGGSGWGVMGLYHGASGVIAREFDPTKVLDFFEQSGITKLFMVPAAMQFVVRQPRARQVDFSRLKYMLYGASPIPRGAAEGMHRSLQMRLRADVRHDRNHRHHRRAAAGRSCRGAGADALGRQGPARHRACDPRCRRQPVAAAAGRRDRHPLRLQHGGLLESAGSDRARRSARTAGCAPATPATSTRTAISTSTTASRT